MSVKTDYKELEVLAQRGRWLVISTVAGSGAGHVGGPLSAMDLMVALYFRVMDVRPQEPQWPERDRFILSKGHSAIGQYTVMALRGYLPVEELKTFDKGRSRLQGHPDVTKLPGLETSTGSLGQGLSVGLGFALGGRLRGQKFHTFILIGDGELQEGMIWEALHIAPRYKLGNLTAILDWNGLQQFGWLLAPGEKHRGDRRDPWAGVDLKTIFEKLGWRVLEIDGHDYSQIVPALDAAKKFGDSDQPTIIVAHTIKGKGVQITEGKFEWHSKVATKEELYAVAAELGVEEVGV
ncbi:MAG: transketolase [Verrucomicrobia bacterium]|nr:transketolase [Verrucomicrobiota bacterium]MBV9130361.1 transketolase [Verrucomicrobiota bacterium]MBV9298075.1 transketolase [Verrucomicrobiota bacterium]MBV9643845.1 transketolase [Verrucomicrobiota bacterium]